MKKCLYCNKKIDTRMDYCSTECKENAELYFKKWKTYKFLYSIIIIVSLIVIIGQAILFSKLTMISKISILIMGATFFVLPFGNTTDSLGVKKTVMIFRILSVLFIVSAVVFIMFDL